MASKKNFITPFQKAVIDEYYICFNHVEAYCRVKGIKVPKDRKKRDCISASVSNMKSINKEYIAQITNKHETKYGKVKDRLVNKLEEVSTAYQQLLELALKDGELSEADELKFRRLRSIMTTTDLNKAVDTIAKLTGAYESQKVEVTNTYTVNWGTPELKENNKPIIDVEHTDEDTDE